MTITDPGGVGKTRLSLEIAHQLQETFQHDVYFVSLVAFSAYEFVIPAIAEAIGFAFSGVTELKIQLFDWLQQKKLLLVLDNLEHLLDGIEVLDELLEHTPHVKILATSREQLNLRAEWVFQIHGLPVPTKIEENILGTNSAVALFIQRARQTQENVDPTFNDLSGIIRICQLVEGLPLGIELAASWANTLSPGEIATEIEKGLDFLVTSKRDVPARHRSIQAVLEYSWNLLSPAEQRVLKKLSVFQGGFSRAGAEHVSGATLSLLSSLVDKTMVQYNPGERYHLHELIRQYAQLKLKENPEEEMAIRDHHCQYYIDLLERHEPFLKSANQKKAVEILIPENNNLRAA